MQNACIKTVLKACIFTKPRIWRKQRFNLAITNVKMIPNICHSVYLIENSLTIGILCLWKCSKFLNTTNRMWYSWLWYFTHTTRNNWMHLIERGFYSTRYIWSNSSRILMVWEGFKDHLSSPEVLKLDYTSKSPGG